MFPLRHISAKKSILWRELPNNKDKSNPPLADSTNINSHPHLILATFHSFQIFILENGIIRLSYFQNMGLW